MQAVEVVPYLVELGILDPDDAISPELSVVAVPRRNNNFKVNRPDGTGVLLKQATSVDRADTLAREADAYRALAALPDPAAAWIPKYLFWDDIASALVIELVPEVRSLAEHLNRTGRASRRIARLLARRLAQLHALPADLGTGVPDMVSDGSPWILRIGCPDVSVLQTASAGSLELIRQVQSSRDFGDHLLRLRTGWRTDAWIHQDLRWDNCLVSRAAVGDARRVTLVDWELFGRGDAAWDVGAIIAGYLRQWLGSVPLVGGVAVESSISRARFPLTAFQPAMSELVNEYVVRRAAEGAPVSSIQEFTAHVVDYAAAHLLQTVFEETQASMTVLPHLTYLVQLSFNIMQRPSEAAVHLLGLDLEGSAAT